MVRNTILLQCLAAILIANSHLEGLYPHRWMAADGLLGNSIFFLLSGYGLMRSEQQGSRAFLPYYTRRLLRIYPALFLVVFAFVFLPSRGWESWTWQSLIDQFIWPGKFGFIQKIVVYYALYYFLA